MSEPREHRWAIVVEHREALVRVARSRGLSADEAEDCAQEALVRAVAFPDLDEARALPFLVTTTLRLCADRGRDRARSTRLRTRLAAWHHDEPPPDDDVCDRAVAAQLARRLDRLPERQRTALLAHVAGQTHADIARLLGSTVKGVESMLGRARVELRRSVTLGAVLLAGTRRRRRAVAVVALVPVAAAWFLAVRVAPATEEPSHTLVPYAPAAASPTPRTSRPPRPAAASRPVPVPAAPARPPAKPSAPQPTPSCLAPSERTGVFPICPATAVDPEDLDDCVEHGVDLSRGLSCEPSPTTTEDDE